MIARHSLSCTGTGLQSLIVHAARLALLCTGGLQSLGAHDARLALPYTGADVQPLTAYAAKLALSCTSADLQPLTAYAARLALPGTGAGLQSLSPHAGHHRAHGHHDWLRVPAFGWLHQTAGPTDPGRPVQRLRLCFPVPHFHHCWRAGPQPDRCQQVGSLDSTLPILLL